MYDLVLRYESDKGGVNNLQVVTILKPSPFNGLGEVVKTFWSRKGLAEKRADRWIKTNPT